jgi:hypothetical protein
MQYYRKMFLFIPRVVPTIATYIFYSPVGVSPTGIFNYLSIGRWDTDQGDGRCKRSRIGKFLLTEL